MQVPALSPNTIIIALLLGGALYGLLGGKQRLRLFILSIYVGIVLAEQLREVVKPYVGMIGSDQLGWILLGLPILVFGFAGRSHGRSHDGKGSAIANIIVGILAGALIISSALHLLPTSTLSAIDRESFLAMIIQQYHLWLLGLLPLVALVLGLIKAKSKDH